MGFGVGQRLYDEDAFKKRYIEPLTAEILRKEAQIKGLQGKCDALSDEIGSLRSRQGKKASKIRDELKGIRLLEEQIRSLRAISGHHPSSTYKGRKSRQKLVVCLAQEGKLSLSIEKTRLDISRDYRAMLSIARRLGRKENSLGAKKKQLEQLQNKRSDLRKIR
jgi:hypothetical protein